MFWSCSVWKDICNFYNKIDDVFTDSVIVRGDKSIFWLSYNCSCRNKMSYELARWHDDVWVISSRDYIVPDFWSCTMLSTVTLFYVAQSLNSDDRRARFQGSRVIMKNIILSVLVQKSQTHLLPSSLAIESVPRQSSPFEVFGLSNAKVTELTDKVPS